MTDAPQGEGLGRPAEAGPPSTGGASAGPAGGPGGSKTVFVALAALLVGLLLGGAIGWAVGGSDDADTAAGGEAVSPEWQAYCDRAEELVAEEADLDLDDEEQAEVMAELVGLAPERYRPRLDALTNLAELEDEPDDLGAAFDLFGDVFGQMMWFVGSLEVECGIDLADEAFGAFDASSDGGSTDFDFDFDTDTGEGAAGSPFDEDDDPFGDDADDGPMGIDAIKAHLASEGAGEAWVDAITSWGVFDEREVALASFDDELTADDALAVCEVVAAYLAEHAPDGSVEVASGDEVLASGPAGGPCTAGDGAATAS